MALWSWSRLREGTGFHILHGPAIGFWLPMEDPRTLMRQFPLAECQMGEHSAVVVGHKVFSKTEALSEEMNEKLIC